MRVAVFTDFDGTITLDDCNDVLVSRFLDHAELQRYEHAFATGEMVLWRLLDLSLRACKVPLDQAIAHLKAHVRLDPSFVAFSGWCDTQQIPLEVVSAGTHEIIAAFLAEAGLNLPINANRADPDTQGFGMAPLDADCPTGVDKGGIIRQAKDAGLFTVFIGDGFSDRLAVPHADLVYAKSGLARWCSAKAHDHVPFQRFADVQADLERRLAR